MIKKVFFNFLQRCEPLSMNEFKDNVRIYMPSCSLVRCPIKSKNNYYFEVPCAFDIETSNFYENNEKRAIMYEWTFGLYGMCVIGRTWNQLLNLFEFLKKILKLNENVRLLCFVHNLPFEFQFLRSHLKFDDVFSLSSRKPVMAFSQYGIEFRCSYQLTGMSLEKVSENLINIPISKMVGDLDYSLVRHSSTPLIKKEILYCINDVRVIMSLIYDRMIIDGNLAKILLTKTAYVRKGCRDYCFYGNEKNHRKAGKWYKQYKSVIENLTINDEKEYKMLKNAFYGGFVHGSPFYIDKVVEDVLSVDLISAYLAQLASQTFPMSKGEYIKIRSWEELRKNLKYYHCIFEVCIEKLDSKFRADSFLSSHKCKIYGNRIINNGRIDYADKVIFTTTELDFFLIEKIYDYDIISIGNFIRYQKGRLPKPLVRYILDLYKEKNIYKGVKGKEVEYRIAKENALSVYGMMVTDIIRESYPYNNEYGWKKDERDEKDQKIFPSFEKALLDYNTDFNRFLFYPWGVYTTAYTRFDLWTAIFNTGINDDYVYSDTDGIKIKNFVNYEKFFSEFNKMKEKQMINSMRYYGFPDDFWIPITAEGEKKPLGFFDIEYHAKKFKTLGAKRYLYQDKQDGSFHLVVAGLNKEQALNYILEQEEDPFDFFTDEMYIPAGSSGRKLHTYIDFPTKGKIIDYMGNEADYEELSSIHLEESSYSLDLIPEFYDYIIGVQMEKE